MPVVLKASLKAAVTTAEISLLMSSDCLAGPKGRWKTRLVNTVKGGSGDVDDGSISPVIRQNLLHW